MPRIYNRMKVQVKLVRGRAQDLQQDESSGKTEEGVTRIYNRIKARVKLVGGRAQYLKQDESPGKVGRRACKISIM